MCADIDRLCARFWWGDSEDKNRIHWKKWKEICISKEKGILGFRSLSSFNKALLAKQGWRIINSPESLMARIFKARYFKEKDFLEAGIPSDASVV